MDPRALDSHLWQQIGRAVELLVVFAGLVVDAAVAFLLAHAVIPSLLSSREAPLAARRLRAVFYPLAVTGLVLAALALWLAIAQAVGVAGQIYPRTVL